MSVAAVGGYVRGLIEGQGLTIAAVTTAADVQANYLWRLEHGLIKEPSARVMGKLVIAAGGNIEQALRLLLREDASADDGVAAAQKQVERKLAEASEFYLDKNIEDLIATRDHEELRRVIAEIQEELEHDRELLSALRGFLAGRRSRR